MRDEFVEGPLEPRLVAADEELRGVAPRHGRNKLTAEAGHRLAPLQPLVVAAAVPVVCLLPHEPVVGVRGGHREIVAGRVELEYAPGNRVKFLVRPQARAMRVAVRGAKVDKEGPRPGGEGRRPFRHPEHPVG